MADEIILLDFWPSMFGMRVRLGIRFFKIGRLTLSFSVARAYRPMAN